MEKIQRYAKLLEWVRKHANCLIPLQTVR